MLVPGILSEVSRQEPGTFSGGPALQTVHLTAVPSSSPYTLILNKTPEAGIKRSDTLFEPHHRLEFVPCWPFYLNISFPLLLLLHSAELFSKAQVKPSSPPKFPGDFPLPSRINCSVTPPVSADGPARRLCELPEGTFAFGKLLAIYPSVIIGQELSSLPSS